MDSIIVRETVKRLRLALGDTQQSFATRLNLAISTAVRYELSRAPRGKALVQLEKVARASGLDECASIFRSALLSELGVDQEPTGSDLPFPLVSGVIVAGPETSEGKNQIAALSQLIREAGWPGPIGDLARKELKLVDRHLKRMRERLIKAGAAEVTQDQNAAIVRLHRNGISPAEIGKRLNVDTDRVEFLLKYLGEKE